MEYVITFLEGIISFISPCMLPMIPLYLSYFAGMGDAEDAEGTEGTEGTEETGVNFSRSCEAGNRKKFRTFSGACAFVAGFTLVFCVLGVFAGTIGRFVLQYRQAVNLITGAIVCFFGLVCMDIVPLPFLRGIQVKWQISGLFSAFLFGVIFSVSLTPCVGAFLGSALMLASASGGSIKGLALLFVYSMGLGLPFLVSAVLIGQLRESFAWIKRHYRAITLICGIFLIVVGIMMATGNLNKLLMYTAVK